MTGAQRPKLLGFRTWLMMLVGALQAISGVVVLIKRDDQEMIDALDVASNEVTTIGIVLIVSGVISLLVALALRGGQNWARILVGAIAVANLVVLVWAAFAYHRLHWYNVAWSAFLYALIAGYMFMDDDVKEYFAQ